MVLGLKRGTVILLPHDARWAEVASESISLLKAVLGDAAVDIQHIGSTSIRHISAKPILDLVIGVRSFEDILCKKEQLEEKGVIYRGQDHPGQHLFVMGDFAADTRTHHIHMVLWGGEIWRNYINFRDYLQAFPEKAKAYDVLKHRLLADFASDRSRYTQGKQTLIDTFLREAEAWKSET